MGCTEVEWNLKTREMDPRYLESDYVANEAGCIPDIGHPFWKGDKGKVVCVGVKV